MTFPTGRRCARRRQSRAASTNARAACAGIGGMSGSRARVVSSRPSPRRCLIPKAACPARRRRRQCGRSATRRFAVHRNNVVAGLVKALEARFPAAEKIVGKEFFAAMARAFVLERPPRSPLLAPTAMNFRISSTRSSRRANFPISPTWRGSRPRARAPITRPTPPRWGRMPSRRWRAEDSRRHPHRNCIRRSKSFARRTRSSRSGR